MKRIEEIELRLNEIREALKRGEDINIAELTAEAKKLTEERAAIIAHQNLANMINVDAVPTQEVSAPVDNEERSDIDIYETREYRRAFMAYVINGTPIPTQYRANSNTLTSDVSAIIPVTTINKIQEKLTSYGMILPLVNRTAFKTGFAIPTNNLKPVATWVNEGQGSDRQNEHLSGSITFGAYKLRCAVSVSLEVDVEAWSAFEAMLVSHITEAMATALEKVILTGTGTNQPTGILTGNSGTTITTKTLTYNLLTTAEGALPVAYENGARWVMSKKTFMAFVGMVDNNGQPIARVNYGVNGMPERTLLGRSVVLTEYLKNFTDTLANNDVFAFLFDFKDYTLNTTYEIGIKTYEDNDTDDIVRKSIMLVDGKVIDDGSLVKLAYKAA